MTAGDPFGLWEEPPPRAAGDVSYTPGEAPPEEAAAVWEVDLEQAQTALERREQTLESMETGLTDASLRLDRFLDSQGDTGRQISYDSGPSAENMLLLALAEVDPERYSTPGEVSYGWQDLLKWGEMRDQFKAFADLMNRQLLQFVWVDTRENEKVIARTKINWTGDLNGYWTAGLSARQVAVHEKSLQLAVRARGDNLRLYLKVIQMAVRIARAVTTPMGVVDALALAWQFVQDVILPVLKENQPV